MIAYLVTTTAGAAGSALDHAAVVKKTANDVTRTDASIRHERRESCHASSLGEDAGMASSSKGQNGRASSRKQSGAGKARVISTRRKDALPRRAIEATTEPLATAVAGSKKKARTKTTRAGGRASGKPNETTAMEAPEVAALALVETETEMEVEASAILEELPVEAVTFPRPAPRAPASPPPLPHHGRRALMTIVSRLLSTLVRWTGVRR